MLQSGRPRAPVVDVRASSSSAPTCDAKPASGTAPQLAPNPHAQALKAQSTSSQSKTQNIGMHPNRAGNHGFVPITVFRRIARLQPGIAMSVAPASPIYSLQSHQTSALKSKLGSI